MKSERKTTLLILAILVGYLGIHRFYAGKIASGVLYLLTGGLFGIGWIVDIILIASDKFEDNKSTAHPVVPMPTQRTQTEPSGQAKTLHTKVAGVTHKNEDGENIQSILKTLNDSCNLILERDPKNPYDPNAIKVYADGEHIGYINRDLARDLAKSMDSGRTVEASIDEITGGKDGLYYGCNITIKIFFVK